MSSRTKDRIRSAFPLFGHVIAIAKYGRPGGFIRDELGARYRFTDGDVRGSGLLVPGTRVVFRRDRCAETRQLVAHDVYRVNPDGVPAAYQGIPRPGNFR